MRPGKTHFVSDGSADGYLFDGYIAEVRNAHPALRFKYRPATITGRSSLIDQIHGAKEADANTMIAGALAYQVKDWNAVDKDGNPLKPTAESVLHLHWNLFESLYRIVIYGTRASDQDPEWPAETSAEQEEARLESQRTGKPIGQIIMEKAEKNSGKGSG